MEPDDNFSLINSYSIDESHPRQLPKAVTYNKVNPTPSVPDVSLVFESKLNDMRNFSNKHVGNSRPLHEDGMKSPKNEDNGPRKVKPMPIAPFPNETYASWRARALSAHYCMSSRLSEDTFGNGALSPCESGIDESYAAARKERDASKAAATGVVSSHHFPLPSERSNHGCSNEKTRDGDVRERMYGVTEMTRQNEAISERFSIHKQYNQSKSMTTRPGSSQGTTTYGQNFHASPCVNGKSQNSIGISDESQSLPDHPGYMKYKHKASIVGKVGQTEYCHQVAHDYSPKQVVDDFGPHCWGESSVPAKGSGRKRDVLRDLYRIVQLQNEQLQSLQAQVEKLLKKNLAESSEQAKPKGRGSEVMCVDEGTQTLPEPSGVSSVGVMTSFIDSNKCYGVAPGDSVRDNSSHCKCSGCPGKTASSDAGTIDMASKECNSQELSCGSNLIHSSGNPVGRKFEAPRPSVRNLRKINQVIEEETESDESTNRLMNEVASGETRSNNHLANVRPESRGRGNPSRDRRNEDRSKSKASCSDGNKVERKGSKSDVASLNGKNIQDKCGKNYKQLENLKHCPGHTSMNHKVLAAKSRQNDDEMTMTLNGVELQTVTEPQLSPEPSIHVDIQDYKEFSGEVEGPSDEESYYSEDEDSSSESNEGEDQDTLGHKQAHNNPSENTAGNQEGHNGNARVGWTFYNNVLGQVNKLLENQEPTHLHPGIREGRYHDENLLTKRPEASPVVYPGPVSSFPSSGPQFQHPDTNNHNVLPSPTLEVVREATLQHLRHLGIDLSSEQHKNKFLSPVSSNNVPNPGVRDVQDARRVTFDPHNNRGRAVGERRPTETSLKIKALALKYLSDEQLACCGYLDPKDNSKPESPRVNENPSNLAQGVIGEMSSSADFTLYGMNGTNLSFTTLRFLQRYHLLPSNGTGPAGIWRHQEGIQQTKFMESGAPARGLDLGDTRSPGHIDYTNDYMDGFRQGANMAMGRNGQGEKVHSSTPANKVDHVLQSPNMVDTGKEVCFLQSRGDFIDGARNVHNAGNQMDQLENKVTAKPRSKGKHRGPHVPRAKGFKENGHQSPCMPGKAESERPPHYNILREGERKQRVHNESLKSSNILDITALRQQPKLL